MTGWAEEKNKNGHPSGDWIHSSGVKVIQRGSHGKYYPVSKNNKVVKTAKGRVQGYKDIEKAKSIALESL